MKKLLLSLFLFSASLFGAVPVITFSASPAIITSGSSTLSWTATGATTCKLNTGQNTAFSSVNASSGTQSVSPTSSTTYTIICADASNLSQVQQVRVVFGTSTLSVTPSTTNCTGNIAIYDICELAFTYSGTAADPWNDVKLSATFTAPDASTIVVGGFYVGGIPTGVSINAGGTGFTVGDVLTINDGGRFLPVHGNATVTVTSTSSGVITGLSLNAGTVASYSTSNPYQLNGGTGTNAAVNITGLTGNVWKIRLAPRQTGSYSWTANLNALQNYATSSGSFTSVAGQNKGFLKPHPTAAYQLVTEKANEPFYILGHQIGFGGDFGTAPSPMLGAPNNVVKTLEDHIATYAAVGFNLWRSAGLNGGYNAPQNGSNFGTFVYNFNASGVNSYSAVYGQTNDYEVYAAHKYQVHVEMGLIPKPLTIGTFNNGGVTSWDVTNLANLTCLYDAIQHQINRWGAYVDIWTLYNENNNATFVPAAFIATEAQLFKAHDPYSHLVTTSYPATTDGTFATAFTVPGLDITSPHNYVSEAPGTACANSTACALVDSRNLAPAVATGITNWTGVLPNQFYLADEAGNGCTSNGHWSDSDPTFHERARIQVWVYFFNRAYPVFWNSFGGSTGCVPNENIFLGTQIREYARIFSQWQGAHDITSTPKTATPGNLGGATAAAYALGSSTYFSAGVYQTSGRTTLHAATLAFTVPASGMSFKWIDPSTGAVLGTATPASGAQTLTIPDFTSDIILQGVVAPTTVGSVTITDSSGSAQTAAPYTLSRAFAQGDIAHYPQPVSNNIGPQWQADVKTRWRDSTQTCNVTGASAVTVGQASESAVKLTLSGCTGDGFLPTDVVTPSGLGGVTLNASTYAVEQSDGGANLILFNSSLTGAYTSGGTVSGPSPGSVKHALISFNRTQAASAPITVAFVDNVNPCPLGSVSLCQQSAISNITDFLTPQWMYAGAGVTVWDADMELTASATTVTADARTMLSNLSLATGKIEYWTQGPVSTTVLVRDETTALSQDFALPGSLACGAQNPCKSLHPVYQLSYYSNWPGVQVDYILENSWAGKLQSLSYALALKAGASLSTVYSNGSANMPARTNWWKQFWSGTQPGASYTDFNLAYLTKSKAIPNYDSSNSLITANVGAAQVSAAISAFNATDKGDIAISSTNSHGQYTLQMSQTGWVPPIGWLETWWTTYLYHPDPNLWTVLMGNAAVAGYLPWHVKEDQASGGGQPCPSSRCFNSLQTTDGFGLPISMDARPTMRSTSPNTFTWGTGGDAIVPLDTQNCADSQIGRWYGCSNSSANINTTWAPDVAHQPEIAYAPYLFTGNPYFLREMQQVAAGDVMVTGPGCGLFGFCRPYGILEEGNIQVRAVAWTWRNIANAAFLSTDGSAQQRYLYEKTQYNVAFREGLFGVTNGRYFSNQANSLYQKGLSDNGTRTGANYTGANNPLQMSSFYYNVQPNGCVAVEVQATAFECNSQFTVFLLDIVEQQMSRQGFPTDALRNFALGNVIGVISGSTNPYAAVTYSWPSKTTSAGNPYLQTWPAFISTYQAGYLNTTSWNTNITDPRNTQIEVDMNDPEGSYVAMLVAASADIGLTSWNGLTGANTRNWILTTGLANGSNASSLIANMGTNPKWAIVPTTAVSNCLITPSSEPASTVGQSISWIFTESGCGSGPFTWSFTGTPPTGPSGCSGTTGTTCTFSGTVAVANTFTPTITVTDGGSNSASNPLTLTVNARPSITTTSPLPGATQGSVYSQTLTVTLGTGASTCRISAGTLAGSGLTLSSGCLISGTASTPGPYSFSVIPTDANGIDGAASAFSLTVASTTPTGGLQIFGPVVTYHVSINK
jgi:hypothetical protein